MATQTDRPSAASQVRERERGLEMLGAHSRALWAVAVLSYVLGDLVTTFVGVKYTPLEEVGPLAAVLLAEIGFEALLGMKFVTVGLFVIAWKLLPTPLDYGVPLGLAVAGVGVTLWNGALILVVLV